MTVTDDSIRDALQSLVDDEAPTTSDPIARVQGRLRARRHRRHRAAVAGATLVALGAAAVVVWVSDPSGGARPPREIVVGTGDDPTTVVPSASAGATATDAPTPAPPTSDGQPALDDPLAALGRYSAGMPAPPLSDRESPIQAWTGTELLVWGGDGNGSSVRGGELSDGAAFDPVHGTWRSLAVAPFAATNGADWSVAVWTGTELLVAGPAGSAGYDPIANVWHPYAAAPFGQPLDGVWTGRELVVADHDSHSTVTATWAFDPTTNVWRTLPEAPQPMTLPATLLWTGTEVLLAGRTGDAGTPAGHVVGVAFNSATNTWRTLAPGPLSAQSTGAAWTGTEVMVANYDNEAAAYNPTTDTWRSLPPIPARTFEWIPTVWVLDRRVVVRAPLALVVLDGDRWIPIPDTGLTSLIPAGRFLVASVGGSEATTDPNPPALGYRVLDIDELARHPRQIAVGMVTLSIPPDYTLGPNENTGSSALGGTSSGPLRFVLNGPAGQCRVSSEYTGGLATEPPPGTTTTVELVDGSGSLVARTDIGEADLWFDLASDPITVDCDTPGQAEAVAANLHVPAFLRPPTKSR